jgi:hypothetical protein
MHTMKLLHGNCHCEGEIHTAMNRLRMCYLHLDILKYITWKVKSKDILVAGRWGLQGCE